MRIFVCIALISCCTPLWAFEFPDPGRPAPALFDTDPILTAQVEPVDEGEAASEGRVIDGWFGRGLGIAVVAPITFHDFGIGIGVEITVPISESIAIVGAATAHTVQRFEGGYYDLGVRGYYDVKNKRTISFFADVGFRLGHGRVRSEDFENSDIVTAGLGPGGFMNLGVEIGPPEIRFQVNLTGGGFVINDDPNFTLLVGVRVGLRVYIGA